MTTPSAEGPGPEPAPPDAGPDTATATSTDAGAGAGADPDGGEAAEEHRPAPAGTTANLVVALVITAVGVAGAAGSWSLGLGSAAAPSAGTWPFLTSIAITCLGVALGALARRTDDAEALSPATWRIAAGVATMVGFVALISVIGFEIPSLLLALVWLRFLGRESWRLSIATSFGIVAAFYAIFVGALAIPIPHLL
ncbi:tripartite tricarboxylate transporter TctB family protein [Murinocardiopsis flavida]|uniref:Tripartite tricarboxylate transporter TctB family protein n=1 Tax=Murinocardiopsis flavida TaxID=645275 RepID=A0A2P8CML9_9ACTN|nr:tripartite tricarboxylate transporter TctB family protein [Murinocardiopsis flavida]PSK86215.1 tripartite tricarboxylate transporter TctB family protein [Murinocardiopsis flavida]